MRRPHRFISRNRAKYVAATALTGLVGLTTLSTGSWTVGLFLGGSTLALLAAWAIIRSSRPHHAVALNYRSGAFRTPAASFTKPSLRGWTDKSGSLSPDSVLLEAHERALREQMEMNGGRRAAVSRFASRRLLARRPIAGRRRENLRRWEQR